MARDGETIFAVASGAPPCAIAILRISGPQSIEAATQMAGSLPPPRTASVRAIRDPRTGELLDRALVIVFPGPASATGEDVVEFHLHGGRAVIAGVTDALNQCAGLRPAEAGEFTRRALIAGRIDLAEAEGLGDLLTAQTERQRRAAMASVDGLVSKAVHGWSARLLDIAAAVEAALDFSDEDDVADFLPATVHRDIRALAQDVAAILAVPRVERLHHGIAVVLAGPPNSGKSTLLNALAQREAAIVSPIAGTTRDRIEVNIVRDGIAYIVTDTAGLAEATDDPVEAIGIDRAKEAVATADILLWFGETPPEPNQPAIWLWPKADLPDRRDSPSGRIAVSAQTTDGLGSLWATLAETAQTLLPREDIIALNHRQHECCSICLAALTATEVESDPLIVAEQLRLAMRALDAVTGATQTEDMLDALFGRFCIGK